MECVLFQLLPSTVKTGKSLFSSMDDFKSQSIENNEQTPKRMIIILCSISLISILSLIFNSMSSFRTENTVKHAPNSKSCLSTTTQPSFDQGYPASFIEDLVRDQQVSIVLPVYDNDRVYLAKLLRSMRNLCVGCTDVPIVIITDDKSKQSIYQILYNGTSSWPDEPIIAASFPKLSIKLLREVLPYYDVNNWTDESHLINGKYQIQSHKKMFGILNGATTRFAWLLDVDSFVFKPMVLKNFLRNYLSTPYIFTTHNWHISETLIPCAQNLTQNFLYTGYTIEVMHWILDREIVSALNDLVLKQYPNWNVSMFKTHVYFFELTYYHFIMFSQIQQKKYLQYRIIETRTLLGGDQSPLLQAVASGAQGGLIEKIGRSITNTPHIYRQIVDIWNKHHIEMFRPTGSELIVLDFALDTEILVMTSEFREDLYAMSQSGFWKDPEAALRNKAGNH